MFSTLRPTTAATMATMATTLTAGNTESPTFAAVGAYRSSRSRRTSPAATGTRTTQTMVSDSWAKVTEICSPASATIHAGITSGAATVVTVVIVTDSATSPRPRYVITFEAVPPGAA